MLRDECYIGQVVQFGRENGEKTIGEIVKINMKKAKVKITEDRGSRSKSGTEWGVPFSMMEETNISPEKLLENKKTKVLDLLKKAEELMSDFERQNRVDLQKLINELSLQA